MNDDVIKDNDVDYRINNNKAETSKWFEYKTKVIGSTPADSSRLNV